MENQDFKKDLQEIFKFFEKTEPDLYLQKKIINLQAKLTQEIDDLSDRDILFLDFLVMIMNYQRVEGKMTNLIVKALEETYCTLPEQLKHMVKGLQALGQVMEDMNKNLSILVMKTKS